MAEEPERPESATLHDGLAPIAALMDEVADLAEAVFVQALPLDGSPAMAELAQEAPYRVEQMQTPITNTIGYALLLGHAAKDAARAIAHQLRHPELLVWAAFVNARAGLDAAGTGFWLVEPGVGAEGRVQRGMALRIHDGREMKKAPEEIPGLRDKGRRVIDSVKATATEIGWGTCARKEPPRVGVSEMPRPRQAIHAVLSYRQAADYDSAADLSWWFYSGLTHSAPYALMQFVDRTSSRPTAAPGMAEAPLMVDGRLLVLASGSVGRSLLNMTDAYGQYLGLDQQRQLELDRRFSQAIVSTIRAMRNRRRGPDST